MEKVTFEYAGSVGSFHITDAEGKDVAVEAGKNYSTADPAIIRELDAAPHAVRRVKDKED